MVLTGRDAGRAATVAKEVGAARGLALPRPGEIAGALTDVGPVDHLVLVDISRDHNRVAEYDIDAALHFVTRELLGTRRSATPCGRDSTTTARSSSSAARPRNGPTPARPRSPPSTRASPAWSTPAPPNSRKPVGALIDRTPTGRLATMRDVVDAVDFLFGNRSVNAVNLNVDGGGCCAAAPCLPR
ncbi:short-chain dehydrogenase [Streptomyces sp. NPDC057474]|uniref:short-chain dehydrogenase n=1 Tax=Streptomyces sp. NPDC057474 TaxID=3346144 RepID=UPI0036A07B80